MKLTARPIPYSSIVGGGLVLVDENGKDRFIITVAGTINGINFDENAYICNQLIAGIAAVLEPARRAHGLPAADRPPCVPAATRPFGNAEPRGPHSGRWHISAGGMLTGICRGNSSGNPTASPTSLTAGGLE